jgi:hypothetical protein
MDLMIRISRDKKELNESEAIASKQDCESEIIKKLLNSRLKINCKALIIA